MEKAGGLFLLGFASIAFPCVLPLVPGYLSAVSAVEAQRLGDPGVGRRVAGAQRGRGKQRCPAGHGRGEQQP